MSRGRLVAAVTLGALLYTGAVVLVAIADLENARLAIVIAVLAGLSFTIAGAFAAATRRLDHLFLSEITRRTVGLTRTLLEAFNRLVILTVAIIMVWFGYKNFLLDLGSFRMPSMIPLGTYTAIVPLVGILIALFAIEQLVNGFRHGFEGPEDGVDTREPVE